MTHNLFLKKEAPHKEQTSAGSQAERAAKLHADTAARAAASLQATQKLLLGSRTVVSSVQKVTRKVPYFG